MHDMFIPHYNCGAIGIAYKHITDALASWCFPSQFLDCNFALCIYCRWGRVFLGYALHISAICCSSLLWSTTSCLPTFHWIRNKTHAQAQTTECDESLQETPTHDPKVYYTHNSLSNLPTDGDGVTYDPARHKKCDYCNLTTV